MLDVAITIPPNKEDYIHFKNETIKNHTNESIDISPKSLSEYIYCYMRLPDYALTYFGLTKEYVEKGGSNQMFMMYRKVCMITALWMPLHIEKYEHEILNEEPFKFTQYMSLIQVNNLELIENVLRKLKEDGVSYLRNLSAPQIWFASSYASIINEFKNNGFLHKKPTVEATGNICKKKIRDYEDTMREIEAYYNGESPNKKEKRKKKKKNQILDNEEHFLTFGHIKALAKKLSRSDKNFYYNHFERYLIENKKLTRKIKDDKHYSNFYLDINLKLRQRKQGKFTSKSHGFGVNQNDIDWECMPSQQLKKHKSKDASEEKLKRCFHAIVNHNQKVSPDTTQMWLINNRALRNLSGCSPKVVADWMLKSQKAIDEENQKFALPCYQNRGRDITQAVNW
ncbi:MAG: hypothetical protein AAFV71_21630 [Cyanobacteria bacterium J06633_8]